MEVLEALLKRRSCRKYKSDKVSDEIIDALLHAGMSGPSAVNKRPWEFYVIKSEEVLNKVRHATMFSNMNAPIAIIVAGNMKNTLPLGGKDYWIEDCSAAIENILLRATDLGLGSLWCGVYPQESNVKKVREIIKEDEKIVPLGIVWIGYPNQENEPRDQYDEKKVHIL